MTAYSSRTGQNEEAIGLALIKTLEEMTSDWEMEFTGPIGPETCLIGDLGFCSIDVVQLAIALEEYFACRGLPFQQVVTTPDGRYVDDIRVSELIDFLSRNLSNLPRLSALEDHDLKPL